MQKVSMTVRGTERNVYLEKKVGPNKWSARTYVGPRGRTTVSGTVTKNTLGSLRFSPQGVNANLV